MGRDDLLGTITMRKLSVCNLCSSVYKEDVEFREQLGAGCIAQPHRDGRG